MLKNRSFLAAVCSLLVPMTALAVTAAPTNKDNYLNDVRAEAARIRRLLDTGARTFGTYTLSTIDGAPLFRIDFGQGPQNVYGLMVPTLTRTGKTAEKLVLGFTCLDAPASCLQGQGIVGFEGVGGEGVFRLLGVEGEGDAATIVDLTTGLWLTADSGVRVVTVDATAIEYSLIASAIALSIIAAVPSLGSKLTDVFDCFLGDNPNGC
jgi:hypothetical protein